MKFLVLLLFLASCANTPTNKPKPKREDKIQTCILRLLNEAVEPLDASKICQDIYAK